MIGRREDIARFQSDLYRDHYYRLLNLVLIECGLILALILVIVYYVFVHPATQYYATTSNGLVLHIAGH